MFQLGENKRPTRKSGENLPTIQLEPKKDRFNGLLLRIITCKSMIYDCLWLDERYHSDHLLTKSRNDDKARLM